MKPSPVRICDAFWDLRDDAYDHAERWRDVSAEAIFQKMAEVVEAAEESEESIDWWAVTHQLIVWRQTESMG